MEGMYFRNGEFPLVPGGEGKPSRRLIAYGGGLLLAEMEFEVGSMSSVHSHEEEQLTCCLTGAFETEVAGVKGRLGPGDSFYSGPGVPHGATCLARGILLHSFTPQREEYKKGS
ncbi:MAG: cupin domain-containing protein [Spirochaetota bacterium]